MSKRTFIVFGVLVVVLVAAIPWLVFESKGDAEDGAQKVAAHLKGGQELFQINCGNCHALYAAGTDGNYGPNLDELIAENRSPASDSPDTVKSKEGRVASAVENGIDSSTTPGRMPPGILNEEQTKEVSEFVAAVAGEG
ncbi:MAG TPA: cytochrome c [Solirubrobacterales bacterium]|nr:cytochrome c [Solirubrobacterales bacterium]